MKKILLTIVGLAIAASSYAQGTVNFANGTTTRITNTVTGQALATTANGFRFGLYVGVNGSTSNQLVLAGLATNATLSAGTFSGGNPFTVTTAVLPSAATGVTISFQVRAWSFSGGTTYEQAYAAALSDTSILVGASAIGTTVLGGGTTPAGTLFGTTGGGLVPSFTVSPLPEPATILLGCLGGAALLVARRRK